MASSAQTESWVQLVLRRHQKIDLRLEPLQRPEFVRKGLPGNFHGGVTYARLGIFLDVRDYVLAGPVERRSGLCDYN